MKKIIAIIICLFLLTGCFYNKRTVSNVITTSYGSYMIPNTWEKNEGHSTRFKYFFTKKGDGNKNPPNNISVEKGTNRYSKDKHIEFREAILRQMLLQSKRYGATLKSSGSTTKKGYIYYTFIMEGTNQTTIQHYIVGDYKYVLVHETIFEGSGEDTHNAANYIVDSFEWKE